MRRRVYDKAFKLLAIELVESGRSITSVAEELGIRSDTLGKWRKAYSREGSNAFPGAGKANVSEEQREIIRLQRALKEAEMERDILKKAVRIFSKSDRRSTDL